MKILQTFQFELMLVGATTKRCYALAGSCRYVFNRALALQKMRYEQDEKKLSYAGLCRELTRWRHDEETIWLKQAHSQALQQSLKDLERSYQNFFQKRAGFPKFKRRGTRDSFRYPQGVKVNQQQARVYLPMIGWVRYRKSREIEGEIKNVMVSRRGDKWYVSFQTEREVAQPVHPSMSDVGIDMGIARFATLSDGTYFEAVNSFKHHQESLARAQRRLSKMKKYSNNWKKQVNKISRLHRKIACIRQNYLHQITHTLSKNHALICVEDLQVKNMSKSACGTIALPGKNVKAKRGLNKSILDQGWYEFRRQLEYKQAWRGGFVIAVPPHYTSQTCPECDHVSAINRQTQARFCCQRCGYEDHADVVGASNILRAGHARLACGERVRLGRSMNQEPAEVTQAFIA